MTLLTTGSVLAAFLAGMVALFAPCCIVFLAPSYLAVAVKNRRWRLLPLTFVFAAGLALVLVPITLGTSLVASAIANYHAPLYYAGGALMLALAGLSLSGRVTFGAMHGVLPVALLTMNAIRNIPPVYLKSAQTLHLSRWQTILTVLFPATLPEVVAGLRIGLTLTLLGVLLAEMFAAKHGLGALIINAMQLLQAEEMISVAVVLFAFAALANALLLWIEHRLHRGG